MGEFSKDSMNLTLSKEFPQDSLNSIKPESIESIDVLRGKSATDAYGEKGKNGVVIITLKPSQK
jgi:TonB-dependent SusC/RagA subfamily outer membrane receptor